MEHYQLHAASCDVGVSVFFMPPRAQLEQDEPLPALKAKGSSDFGAMPSSSLDGDSHSDDGGAGGAGADSPRDGGTAAPGGPPAKRARKIPKLPMVRHGRKWYRARLLKDTAQRVHIGAQTPLGGLPFYPLNPRHMQQAVVAAGLVLLEELCMCRNMLWFEQGVSKGAPCTATPCKSGESPSWRALGDTTLLWVYAKYLWGDWGVACG